MLINLISIILGTIFIAGMRPKSTARMSTAGSGRTKAVLPTKSCAVECGGFTYLVGVTKGKKFRAYIVFVAEYLTLSLRLRNKVDAGSVWQIQVL